MTSRSRKCFFFQKVNFWYIVEDQTTGRCRSTQLDAQTQDTQETKKRRAQSTKFNSSVSYLHKRKTPFVNRTLEKIKQTRAPYLRLYSGLDLSTKMAQIPTKQVTGQGK